MFITPCFFVFFFYKYFSYFLSLSSNLSDEAHPPSPELDPSSGVFRLADCFLSLIPSALWLMDLHHCASVCASDGPWVSGTSGWRPSALIAREEALKARDERASLVMTVPIFVVRICIDRGSGTRSHHHIIRNASTHHRRQSPSLDNKQA